MNVLQLLPELNTGGVETGTVDLTKVLISQGHKVVVISNGGKMVADLTACGGIHYSLPVHEKSLFTVIKMVSKIAEIMVKEEIDIVHARSRVPAISGFWASYRMRVPFVTTCHGYYSTHLLSRVMGWGKYVIVSSHVIARHMINDFKVPRERIRLIPRGVDLDRFKYREPDQSADKKEFTIAIIGRITPIKGHVYFIRALSKVVRLMPNIKVMIIGDAPQDKPKYRQELELLVRRLSLSRYVNFLGQRQDVPQQLSKIDLLVVASIGEEAFGRTIVEAQASGVPVVATKVGGIVDIIKDPENGILVSPRDWNGLSDAIIKVLKDKTLRHRLSAAGRVNVEKNFSLAHMYKRTVKVYNEAVNTHRILIIKWSALGDILLSIPAIHAIRERFPKSDIMLLTGKVGREILGRYPYAKDFFIFNHNRGYAGIREMLDMSAELRRQSIDIVLDLQNNNRSRIISFLSFIPRRIGYRNGRLDMFLTEGVDGAKIEMPPVKHQFRLLKQLGVDTPAPEVDLMITDEEASYAENILSQEWVSKNQVLIGINCGASQKWQSKRWDIGNIARLCDLLAQKKIRVVITGTRDDEADAREIVGMARSKPINAVGKTGIMQLAAIIRRCRVFISSDSAPMHMAAFLGVPYVAIFGPTDHKRHLEPSGNYRVIHKKLRCTPCYKPRCHHRKCMERISPEEVGAAAMDLLSQDQDMERVS